MSSGSSSTRRMRRRCAGSGGADGRTVEVTTGAETEKTRRTVVPLPGALSISMSALWRCTMPKTMARPRPVPRSPLVVKNGSRQRRFVSSSMPTPVSLTSTDTLVARSRSPSGRPLTVRVRRVSVPPSGIASTALKMRLVSASRISASAPIISGKPEAKSV